MLMIPTGNTASPLLHQPDGPQSLAATLWGCGTPGTIRRRVLKWMEAGPGAAGGAGTALEAIAWACGLPLLRQVLSPGEASLLCELLSAAASVDPERIESEPMLHQLLGVELAWTLASQAPDARRATRWVKSGKMALSLGFDELLDRQGLPSAEHYRLSRPLFACWFRCRELAKKLPAGTWPARTERRFARFVRNVVRTSRPAGHALLDDDSGSLGQEYLPSVLAALSDETDRRLAAVALRPLSLRAAAKPPKKSATWPPPSVFSEAGAIAVLRRNWSRDDERMIVLFKGRETEIELIASGQTALSGAWRFEVRQDGRPLQISSDWEATCWCSDDDVEYLELEAQLSEGVVLQRHVALAREDRFLLLADAVFCPSAGQLEYCGSLPLSPNVRFSAARENWEGALVDGGGKARRRRSARPLARVLPLALPEWRQATQCGGLTSADRTLELRQAMAGQRLFAPLFIDLDPGRFRRRLTWRQLTVAQGLAKVSADVAAGYRIAIGRQQWLVYRSLGPAANRTLLGHNLSTESLIARFGGDGQITPIVEIEA
jgi:hypothetical protein